MTRTKTVHRLHHTARYVVLANATAQDSSISYAALGLLTRMLSMPEDWEFRPLDFVQPKVGNNKGAGKDLVYALFRELIDARYVLRTEVRNSSGTRLTITYDIHESPVPNPPDPAKPDLARPDLANPDPPKDTQSPKDPISPGQPGGAPTTPDPVWEWVLVNVLGDSPEDAAIDPSSNSRPAPYVASLVNREKKRLGLTPKQPLNRAARQTLAAKLPGLIAFWNAQHRDRALSFPTTKEKFATLCTQWYAAGCPSSGAGKLPPRLLYDPNCPHGCDRGFLPPIPPSTERRECECRRARRKAGA